MYKTASQIADQVLEKCAVWYNPADWDIFKPRTNPAFEDEVNSQQEIMAARAAERGREMTDTHRRLAKFRVLHGQMQQGDFSNAGRFDRETFRMMKGMGPPPSQQELADNAYILHGHGSG